VSPPGPEIVRQHPPETKKKERGLIHAGAREKKVEKRKVGRTSRALIQTKRTKLKKPGRARKHAKKIQNSPKKTRGEKRKTAAKKQEKINPKSQMQKKKDKGKICCR